MLNHDMLFDALGDIDDEYILSALNLLGYLKEEKTMRLNHIKKMSLLAAVVAVILTLTAFATYFIFSYRTPDPSETFQIHWDDSISGTIQWKDAKLAVTFPQAEESRLIEFRPGWLPFELPSELGACAPSTGLGADTWFSRLTAESLCREDGPHFVPEFQGLMQPLLISYYAMSQFNEGALLMLNHTPEKITEEHWDEQDVDVMYFRATQHFDAIPEHNMPAKDSVYNYVVLANEEAHWVLVVTGELDMDTMLKVAKNLEIRETGETVTAADFKNHYAFFDGGVG